MSTTVVVLIGALVVGLAFLVMTLSTSMDKALRRAKAEKSIQPVLEAVGKKRMPGRASAYNFAIRRLWDGYERGLALELIKELAKSHADTRIAQYWLGQALNVEPALARETLSEDFLAAHFKPEVAAQCGPVS